MADPRLRRLFEVRETANGDELFGEYDLVPVNQRAEDRAPIERVAILTEAFLPKVDGVSKTSYLTIRYLQQTGREVLIFGPDSAVTQVGPSEVIPLPSLPLPVAPETRIALPHPMIARRLEDFRPDLIHLASPALMSMNGMVMGRHLNVPIVANYQTDLPRYADSYGAPLLSEPIKRWLRFLHNGCHINLVPTRSMADQLNEWGFRRLRVWGRGVNLDRFNPTHRSEHMRKRLLAGRPEDSLLIIYVGRLAMEKHVELLRDVAELPGVALTIIGDGMQREELEEFFVGTGTHFTGYLFGGDLASAFASADVFTFTGPNETFGQVVQEAMASGLPVIVTDQGAVGDLVKVGRTGYVVEHQATTFADAARILRDNPALRIRMAEEARRTAETRPWSAIMGQLEQYYCEAVEINQRMNRLFGADRPISAILPEIST